MTRLKLQDRLYPLHAALFTGRVAWSAKYALTRLRNNFQASYACRWWKPR
jgi:hypothetical protein